MDYHIFFNATITPATVAVIVTIAALVAAIRARTIIVSWIRQRVFTRTGLFWTVNGVFMAVSVLHAGTFFGIAGHGPAAYLGFAVSFFLDLVTIILMQALLESRYRGEPGRARQFLAFIAICCGTSTFANLAISLNDFDAAAMLPNAPDWVQIAAPYVLASFPLFVIMMSIAAEMIVNLRPLESLDVKEYEADEKKRLDILKIRNDYLEHQAAEEQRTLAIRAAMKANKAAHRPGILWWQPRVKEVDIDAVIDEKMSQLEESYEQRVAMLIGQLIDALNGHGNTVNHDFKQPLNLDEYRRKEDGAELNTDALLDIHAYASPVISTDETPPQAVQDTDVLVVKSDVKTAGSVALQWQKQGFTSVSIDDIIAATGLTAQKVNRAKKHFAKTSRNPNFYRIPSVIKWLETAL